MEDFMFKSEWRKSREKNFFEASLIFVLTIIAVSALAIAILTANANGFLKATVCDQVTADYQEFYNCYK